MRILKKYLPLLVAGIAIISLAVSCRVQYSFTGTSIQSDVNSITINFFEYTAAKVNPNLSNDLTEAVRTQFRKMTRLEQVDMDGDLEISGTVTGYDVSASAVTANEVAAQNRLTITISIEFTNRKHSEDDFTKSFNGYADYDSMESLDAVESNLCQEIIDKLVDDIFNATVANW